jgi:kynureninase
MERALDQHGSRVALVMLSGVQYLTGQFFDLQAHRRTRAAQGCVSASISPTPSATCRCNLHDSGADFAVWCSYKYLNSGPGAVAGCFVHERHARAHCRASPAGGARPATRFRMGPDFRRRPAPTAGSCRTRRSRAGAAARVARDLPPRRHRQLREKSIALTGYFEDLIQSNFRRCGNRHTARTRAPRLPAILRVQGPRDAGRSLFAHLHANGIVVDWREPDVIRAAPTPLYNRYRRLPALRAGGADWAA